MTDVEPAAEPQPMIAGTFAIYQRSNGEVWMVTDIVGRGVEKKKIPPVMVKAVQGQGPLGKMFAKLAGGQPDG